MIKIIGLGLIILAAVVFITPHFVQAINPDISPKKSETVAYYSSFDAERNNGLRNLGGTDGSAVPVISLSQLPIGNYLVTANTWITNAGSCSLDPAAFTTNPPTNPWPADKQFTEAVKITEQRDLTLYCQITPGGTQDMQEYKAGLTAIKIDILNVTP